MFTRTRKDKTKDEDERSATTRRQHLSLLRLGRAGTANHAEWILQAIQELREPQVVDRAGVWLEDSQGSLEASGSPVVFQGEVWERGIGSGPPGWTRLSGDALLPRELIQDGKTCEYDLEGRHAGLILGPVVGLGRALWAPVTAKGILRGMVLLGSKAKQATLPRALAEKAAEELGVLLEVEEWRRLAATRKADLELEQRVRGLLGQAESINRVLAGLAESCTRGEALGGVGAAFAVIGERSESVPACTGSSAAVEEQLLVRAHSGEDTWAYSVKDGPLESFWRQAVERQQIVGAEADRLPHGKDLLRIVAIPLGHGRALCGALLAGLSRRKATLESLDRLELRALLATEVLEKERRAAAASGEDQWYRALLESSEQLLVLLESDGVIRGMSRGAREILGSPANAVGSLLRATRLPEFFAPPYGERLEAWLATAADSGGSNREPQVEGELRNGQMVTLSWLAIPGQRFHGIRLERHKATTAARTIEEVEEELQQAIEWLEEGVVVFDENGGILARNRRFLQILGVSEKLAPRTLEQVIAAAAGNFADARLFADEWRALGRSGEGTQEELPIEHPVPQIIERCTRPMIAASGKKLGRVEVYREVTARRMFQSRMVQAEKLAALGQRASAILHELSNPLTTILGNAQRMILRDGSCAYANEVHRILEEAERATAILRQLLVLSRETRPERRLISLNEVVRHAVELQRASLTGTSIRLEVDTAEWLPRIEGDSAQLQQVLLNLLQNAQQAIEQTGRRGTIGLRTSAVALDRVRLEVCDDGPGIPEAIQARIFDPFFTTKAEGVGTGLGLAIVNGFVRQHGGSIAVHSPSGGGARFVIDLPAAEQRFTEAPVRSGSAHMASAAGGLLQEPPGREAGKVPRVLVVEDETTVANLIADVLRDEGMHVDVLLDGRRALEAAHSACYDLAICDLKMPEMDGRVFYGRLQQEENPLREHILFVTGDVLAQHTHDFLERNRLPHLAKPFRVEELSEAVRRMLWGEARAAAAGVESDKAVENGTGP